MTNPIPSIFGKISPPPGCGVLCSDPITGLGKFFGVLLNIILVVFGILLITYMIWGAMDWIISEGDKDAKEKANAKITNALMGILVFIITLTIFGLITGNVLGILKKTPAGWELNIPIINQSPPSSSGPVQCPGSCSTVRQCDNSSGKSLSGYSCDGRCANNSDCVCCSQ